MNKKDLAKLKPMTLVEVEFSDAPNAMGILVDKPVIENGDISLRVLFPEGMNSHTVHTQIVKSHGVVKLPNVSTLSVESKNHR